jgi:hypothetical protein
MERMVNIMTKKIICIVLILFTLALTYVGVMNDMVQKAEADDNTWYTVHVMQNNKYGYIPKHDFEITKSSLEVFVKLYYWNAAWLNNGDLLIKIEADADENRVWFITLMGNDPEIDTLKTMVNNCGLKCTIPAK